MDPNYLLNESIFCNQASAFKKMSLDGCTIFVFVFVFFYFLCQVLARVSRKAASDRMRSKIGRDLN